MGEGRGRLRGDVLRGEWGYEGMVTADYSAVVELMTRHHVAADKHEAAILARTRGVDVDLPNGDGYPR